MKHRNYGSFLLVFILLFTSSIGVNAYMPVELDKCTSELQPNAHNGMENKLSELQYSEILEGLSVIVADKTTPAVYISASGFVTDYKDLTYSFFDANHNRLGYISVDTYNIMRERAEARCPGQLDLLQSGKGVWYVQMFNDYCKKENVVITEIPPINPIFSNNPTQAAPASHAMKDHINALTLRPSVGKTWDMGFCLRIQQLANSMSTNFEKMWAVYDYIATNYSKQMNCVGYANALKCAFDIVGFETYSIRGSITASKGGWTAHSWVGVNIGGKLYYFDANIPGRYNGARLTYFAVPAKAATFYAGAFFEELDIWCPIWGPCIILSYSEIPSSML